MLSHSLSSFVDLDLALKATVTVGRIGLVKETTLLAESLSLIPG